MISLISNELKGTSSLVIGGAGFVGSNLVRRLLETGSKRVVVVDNLLSSEAFNVPEDDRVEFLVGSINSLEIRNSIKDEFEYIFHLPTYHGNQSSIHSPLADHENNLLPTLSLCEHIKEFSKPRKIVYSSAGCTVAEKTFDDVNATQEDSPVSLYLDSPYQISKVVGEFYFNYYLKQYGLPVVKARFQNVYGPGEYLGAGEWRGTPATVWRNVTPTFIYRAIKQLALPIEGGGQATRDFIYVDDIVEGLLLCAKRGEVGEVYNLAAGVEVSILELATTINRLANNPTPLEVKPYRDWDRSGKRYGSTEKAKEELGFEACVGLEEGLKKTIQWTSDNIGRIEQCISKHKDKLNL